jgi:two-component system NarL family response regulator
MRIEVYSLPANVNGHGFISWTIPSFFFEVFHSAVRLSMTDCVPSSSIRALLLIENRLMREALARLFRKRPDLIVVGQTSPADETPPGILKTQCNVLVGDAFLAARLQAGFTAKGGLPAECKIILVGMEAGEEQFIAAVRSGVTGYLLQDASASDVVAAVRAVFRGEAVCPPQLCSVLFRFVAQMSTEVPLPDSPPKPDLTLRQQQLVSLVAKGLTNKEIASHLNLSEFTVRNHIHNILKQVDASSRSEAVETIRACGYSISS